VAAAEPVGASGGNAETRYAATIIGANLLQRLERLTVRLLPPEFEIVFCDAKDGKPAGTSVLGVQAPPFVVTCEKEDE
jgi:hypothetical protein